MTKLQVDEKDFEEVLALIRDLRDGAEKMYDIELDAGNSWNAGCYEGRAIAYERVLEILAELREKSRPGTLEVR